MVQNKLTAQILDGKLVSGLVRDKLAENIKQYVEKGLRRPGLAVLLVGDNPASEVYVKNKIQSCRKAGIESFLHRFSKDARAAEILALIAELNASEAVDGILVQLPLPAHLPTDRILEAVLPGKDVDGLHPANLGLLMSGKPGLRPCTPQGVMVLLEHYQVPISGRKAVVIGRSNLVGKPVALMLMEKNATVTMCHSKTANLEAVAREADILVVAAGREEMVRGSWVKPGSVVVDVGIHRRELPDGQAQLVGDVKYDEVAPVAALITPVPGGVGPMTVAMLLSNAVAAYRQQLSLKE